MQGPKWTVLLAMMVSLALVLAACDTSTGTDTEDTQGSDTTAVTDEGGGEGDDMDTSDEVYYWVSQLATLPLFVENDHVALEIAAENLGVQYEIAGPTDADLPGLISTLDQVCAQNPAGVMVVGWDPSLAESVNACIAAGVPTVAVDGDIPDSDRLTFVGTDWCAIGETQARAMEEALGGSGQVATLSIINAPIMIEARECFADYLADTDIEIVADEDDEGNAAVAAEKTAALLTAFPDLAGIAGFDAESGSGIVIALTEADRLGDITITTMQGPPELFETVADGTVDTIIVQKRQLFTYYALQVLYDYNHNGLSIVGLDAATASPIPSVVDTGLLEVTSDNVDQILESLGLN